MELITRFFAIELPLVYKIENGVQSCERLTWGEVFDRIKSEHFHTTKTFTCPHAESLYDHLINAGLYAYNSVKSSSWAKPLASGKPVDENFRIKALFCALLHDIGKVSTRTTFGSYTAFKGHSLVGGAMIRCSFSPKLTEEFGLTRDDWEDIAMCADCHMCGYFADSSLDYSSLNMQTFQVQPAGVRELLPILRKADHFGKEPHSSDREKHEQEGAELLITNSTFANRINSPLDVGKFIRNVAPALNGVMVILQGLSASGKSTIGRQLLTLVPNSILVSRDEVIEAVARRRNGRDMTYIEAVNDYHTKRGDDKSYVEEINKNMINRITNGLVSGAVVFVDTIASRHPESAKNIIGEHNCTKVALWVSNLSELTEENCVARNGIRLEKQLPLTGDRDFFAPFGKTEWNKLISVPEGGSWSVVKPHLSFGVSLGFTDRLPHIARLLNELSAQLNTRPRLPTVEETMHTPIEELVHKLWVYGKSDAIRTFFRSNYYITSFHTETPTLAIVIIKYMDGINRLYRPKWARRARGIVLAVSDEECISLKNPLQRGIEIFTNVHKKSDITETQDVSSSSDYSDFDDIQRELLTLVNSSSNTEFPEPLYLTSKVDGSLLIVNCYPLECKECSIITPLLNDEILHVRSASRLYTISTQGTLFIGGEMMDYFITALNGRYGLELSKSTPVFEAWSGVRQRFGEEMDTLLDTLSKNGFDCSKMLTLSFEAVCANRTTYKGTLHTELACSYPESFLSYLGAYGVYKGDEQFVQHYRFPVEYDQPMHVKLTHTGEVERIMNSLHTALITDTVDAFCMETFGVRTTRFDPEGFVAYYRNDYSKLKSVLYYMSHKIRQENIALLISLPSHVHEYFPALAQLKFFVENGAECLKEFAKNVYELVDARADLLVSLVPEKCRATVNTKKFYAIVFNTNTCANEMCEIFRTAFNSAFAGQFAFEKFEEKVLVGFCKAVMMEVEKCGYSFTDKPSSPVIRKFYELTMG
jgi:hypothetical protein